MELYGQKGESIPQKAVIFTLELVFLAVSYWILFLGGGEKVLTWFGIQHVEGNMLRRTIVFVFSLIVFVRMGFMMIFLLKRRIPWEESLSVPLAFALYYIGFALLVLPSEQPLTFADYFGLLLFVVGSGLNTISELQRHFWKKRAENKGKLFTKGLFNYSMHINYFGDVLWVTAYAIITHNPYSVIIPILLLVLFIFFNIPQLDNYLAGRYGKEFEEYSQKTKKLIPFIY